MTVRIIDPKPDPEVVKHVSCRKCGARLEYVPIDVRSEHGTDYGGGPDGSEWVECQMDIEQLLGHGNMISLRNYKHFMYTCIGKKCKVVKAQNIADLNQGGEYSLYNINSHLISFKDIINGELKRVPSPKAINFLPISNGFILRYDDGSRLTCEFVE